MTDFSAYAKRDLLLKELGYENYAAYLRSDLWHSIRGFVMRAHRGKCGLCGGMATEVHHVSYSKDALLGRGLLHYFPICNRCHKEHEFDSRGRKVSAEACHEAMRKTFMNKIREKSKPRKRMGKVAVRAAIRHKRKSRY